MNIFLKLIAAVGLAIVAVFFWVWFIVIVVGLVGLMVFWFVVTQLSGTPIVVRNSKTKEVLGYIRGFKYHKA